MQYYLTELHAHTKHSDGQFSVAELINKAHAFGYKILAITDHNTQSGLQELTPALTQDLLVLPGMEWTTFYGHLLVLGAEKFVDWRKATVTTIDQSLAQVRMAGGIAGIAHPYSVGSPLCTGCRWDFQVKDYQLVNFIEIWNSENPDDSRRSQQAYDWWLSLLDAGYQIAASTGRDWHSDEPLDANTALLYLGCEELTQEEAFKNLGSGNYYLSLGPQLNLSVEQRQKTYYMGAELAVGIAKLKVGVQATTQTKMCQFNFVPETVVIFANGRPLLMAPIEVDQTNEFSLNLQSGYLRVEIWGRGKGQTGKRLVISNPFYIA